MARPPLAQLASRIILGVGLFAALDALAQPGLRGNWQGGWVRPSVLSPASLDARDNVTVASSPTLGYGYGLGFQALRWGDTVAVGHSGNLAGYTSMVLYDRKTKFGVIVLRSAAGGEADAGRLAGRVFRRLRSRVLK